MGVTRPIAGAARLPVNSQRWGTARGADNQPPDQRPADLRRQSAARGAEPVLRADRTACQKRLRRKAAASRQLCSGSAASRPGDNGSQWARSSRRSERPAITAGSSAGNAARGTPKRSARADSKVRPCRRGDLVDGGGQSRRSLQRRRIVRVETMSRGDVSRNDRPRAGAAQRQRPQQPGERIGDADMTPGLQRRRMTNPEHLQRQQDQRRRGPLGIFFERGECRGRSGRRNRLRARRSAGRNGPGSARARESPRPAPRPSDAAAAGPRRRGRRSPRATIAAGCWPSTGSRHALPHPGDLVVEGVKREQRLAARGRSEQRRLKPVAVVPPHQRRDRRQRLPRWRNAAPRTGVRSRDPLHLTRDGHHGFRIAASALSEKRARAAHLRANTSISITASIIRPMSRTSTTWSRTRPSSSNRSRRSSRRPTRTARRPASSTMPRRCGTTPSSGIA